MRASSCKSGAVVSRRVLLGFVDQGLSSGSNAILLIALARTSSVDVFAQVSLALLGITIVLGVTRGFLGTRIAALSASPELLRLESRYSLTFAVIGGVLVSLIAGFTLRLTGASLAVTLIALGAWIVLVQDLHRHVAIATSRTGAAVASDGVWLIGSLVALAVTLIGSTARAELLVGIWLGSACAALAVVAGALRVIPGRSGFVDWLRRGLVERASFGAEGIISGLNSALVMTAVTAGLGLSAVAAIRGAGTLIGPLSLLLGALPLVVVPELSRAGARSGRQIWRRTRPYGLVISLGAVGVGALGLVLPDRIGNAILGETWTVAREVLPIMGVEYVFLAWMSAGSLGLRLLNKGRALLGIRLAYSTSAVLVTVVASQFGDVLYVSGGLALVAGVFAWLMRLTLFRGLGAIP